MMKGPLAIIAINTYSVCDISGLLIVTFVVINMRHRILASWRYLVTDLYLGGVRYWSLILGLKQ